MKLIDEKKAAELLACSVATLQKNRQKGGGLPFHRIGRNIRYSVDELIEYIHKNKHTSTSEYTGGGDGQ